jgi:hypothetical protein
MPVTGHSHAGALECLSHPFLTPLSGIKRSTEMEAVIENEVQAATNVPTKSCRFISSYRGVHDYSVQGVNGRVSVRGQTAESQAFYGIDDPQLIGTVVNGSRPVDELVLAVFQQKQDALFGRELDAEKFYARQLTTAKWYQGIGWIRCEPGESKDAFSV